MTTRKDGGLTAAGPVRCGLEGDQPREAFFGWGPRTDPILEVRLAPTWHHYPPELIADNDAYEQVRGARTVGPGTPRC